MQDAIEPLRELANGRFQLKKRLGEGGFGVVYQAFDRERGVDVALKILTRLEAEPLIRFKQEFRSLANVRHPNLIALHELFSDNELWFFTMELVSGTAFSDYVRHRDPAVVDSATMKLADASTVRVLLDFDELPELEVQIEDDGRLDVARLRSALPQLVDGLAALHALDKLHCDLKPSNVLVTAEGRVVILDFGLVRELQSGPDVASDGTTAGTPSYMSPEHARGEALTTASDWYSVGVMLFEALTGHVPFVGSVLAVLQLKISTEAPAPSDFIPGLPEDLEALCVDLIRLDKAKRPQVDEIRRRSNARAGDGPQLARMLVGREREITALEAAFLRAAQGGSEQRLVCGPSGAGKTTLVRCFLDRLPAAAVLSSRCYEQESVPYKGIDGLVDALTRRLGSLTDAQRAEVLGGDGEMLARIFPVLRVLHELSKVEAQAHGSRSERNEACAALKLVLGRLAELAPIVLYIDDAQWSDEDSAAVLAEIFSPPSPSRIFLLATGREPKDLPSAEPIVLSMLGQQACRDLARRLLGDDPRVERIAKEGRGDALLVESLCRDLKEGDGVGEATLEAATARRLARLDPPSRRVLELLACAGTPIDTALLARAHGDEHVMNLCLAELSARRLVRVRTARAATFVEIAHDRLRDVVVAKLPSYAKRVHHAALADVLERTRGVQDELLAVHWQAAGDDALAAERYARAAAASEKVLAFDRAARLYRQALALASKSTSPQLYARLGEALAQLDRRVDAKQAFLSAAALAKGPDAAVFEQRAHVL